MTRGHCAPPDCPRCLAHLRSIAERHGRTFEEPPPAPPPPGGDSDKVGAETPSATAGLPHLGEGWRLVQYTDPDRWWLHQHDRIRGYINRYTNMSGNKTGWEAFAVCFLGDRCFNTRAAGALLQARSFHKSFPGS